MGDIFEVLSGFIYILFEIVVACIVNGFNWIKSKLRW